MTLLRRAFVALTLMISTVAASGATAQAASPATPPRFDTFPAALLYSVGSPAASPQGANDFGCKPSVQHPEPVVLVHGTIENAFDNWGKMAPELKAEGYCVFALNYGGTAGTAFRGLTDIAASAGELKAYVEKVLSATGAAKVDVVGHSQGGMMPRYYLKNLGGASKVDQLVALSPSNYGTTFFGVLPLIAALPGGEQAVSLVAPSIPQQRQGSTFLKQLNAGGDTVPGVRYTVIQTRSDQIVTPSRNAFLIGQGVQNIDLQRQCALDLSDHLSISYSSNAIRLVKNALDPATAKRLCVPALPLFG